MYAAYRNHPGVVQVLLEHGADLTVQNEDEMTATDLAVGQGNTAGINFYTGLCGNQEVKVIPVTQLKYWSLIEVGSAGDTSNTTKVLVPSGS